jgi:hypothetical protein
MRIRAVLSFALALCACAVLAGAAAATPVSVRLTAVNGEGSFDDTLRCSQGGDGPSWRYLYSGLASPTTSPFAGTWTGTVEVHQADARLSTVNDGGTGAFVPEGTGRLELAPDRGGTADLEFSGGGCGDAPLALTPDANGDPEVAGTLPAQVTGGTGPFRALTGTGTVAFVLQLGPGADNAAVVDLNGDFQALVPRLAIGTPTARWMNLTRWLQHVLTVFIPVTNLGDPSTTGDAFGVSLTAASLAGAGSASGVPATLGRVNAGRSAVAAITVSNVQPGRTYTLTAQAAGRDALDEALPGVSGTRSVQAPLLPPPLSP